MNNAISKSFVATSKVEFVHPSHCPIRKALKSAVFEYLEMFYNRGKLRSSLGYVTSESFEELGTKEAAYRKVSTKPL